MNIHRHTQSSVKSKSAFGISLVITMIALAACSNTPESLQAKESAPSKKNNSTTGSSAAEIFTTSEQRSPQSASEVLQGQVTKILEGNRYTYLEVAQENGDTEWLVTRQGSFKKGKTYRYGSGIVKTGYYSTHLSRTFDKIRLVAQIAPINAAATMSDGSAPKATMNSEPPKSPQEPLTNGNAIPLKNIVANPDQYSGKVITVTGKVMKINPNIMNRNWIHIQDGTANEYDFVITAQKTVPVGHTTTFEGVLNVNRDFGAGYQYDIILEHAELLP